MSAARRSRSGSSTSSYAELKVKWELWCEEEGVNEPPNLVKVDTLRRLRTSLVSLVEQKEADYVKFCSEDNRQEEAKRDSSTEVLVQYDAQEPTVLKGLQVKGKLVSAPLSCAVGRIIQSSITLTTVKLIKCSLVAESIHMLSYLLKNSNVTHLYLDENIIPYQNWNLILEDNAKLLHLSLRLNMINDCGADYLARSLTYKHPHHQILRSLNLNCNLIDDDGACSLAKALRWNRNLTCLALAGNRIGDKGGIALAQAFLPFKLTPEELEFRAELLCNRLLQMKTIMEQAPQNASKRSSGKDNTEPGQPPVYPGENSDLNEVMLYYYALEKWADEKVPVISNPIVADVIETENGSYMCKGNDALWYLNLSYNLITEDALLAFMEVFAHQETAILEFDRKLWRFEYEGNPYDPEHPVIEEIETYLNPYKPASTVVIPSRRESKASAKSRVSPGKK